MPGWLPVPLAALCSCLSLVGVFGLWPAGLEGPGVDQILGPGPIVGDLQDPGAGDPGRDGEQAEPEGFGFRVGPFTIEGEVPQPRGPGDGQCCELQ